MINLTPDVPCKYGDPIGRRSAHPGTMACFDGRIGLQRVRLDSGGYDRGGAYWGLGDRLYAYYGYDTDGDLLIGYFRAVSRTDALAQLRELAPDAKISKV